MFEKLRHYYQENKDALNFYFGVIGTIIGIIGLIIGIIGWQASIESSKQLNETREECKEQLDIAKNEITNVSSAGKDEILLAIYEAKSFGFGEQAKEFFFKKTFGISYEQAQSMLEYSNKADSYYLGFSSLMLNDYPSSLYHFEMALIKDPLNNESKIGKSISLIGLGRTNESRQILFEFENTYPNKKFIKKLLGDSYCSEGNYSACNRYYIRSLEDYAKEIINYNKKDSLNLGFLRDICNKKDMGFFNTPNIWVDDLRNGGKRCGILLDDPVVTFATEYNSSLSTPILNNFIMVRGRLLNQSAKSIITIGPEVTITNP